MTATGSWFRENSVLVTFLIGQALTVGAALASLIAYSARLESRVHTLETRGSPHLERIDNRLTALESRAKENGDRLERIVDVLTRQK
jgi:uncharacterized coiled-coil protein SlyX